MVHAYPLAKTSVADSTYTALLDEDGRSTDLEAPAGVPFLVGIRTQNTVVERVKITFNQPGLEDLILPIGDTYNRPGNMFKLPVALNMQGKKFTVYGYQASGGAADVELTLLFNDAPLPGQLQGWLHSEAVSSPTSPADDTWNTAKSTDLPEIPEWARRAFLLDVVAIGGDLKMGYVKLKGVTEEKPISVLAAKEMPRWDLAELVPVASNQNIIIKQYGSGTTAPDWYIYLVYQ